MTKNIKILLQLLIVFIIGFTLTSCGDDDDPVVPIKPLTVSPTSLNFTSDEGTKVINISADASISWTISNIPSWCSFSISSGSGNKAVSVQAEANTLKTPREATVKVSGGGKTIDVDINQEANIILLSVSPSELEFIKDGGSKDVEITADETTTWEIADVPSWLSFSATSGTGSQTIRVETNENSDNVHLSVTLKISTSSESEELEVSQAYDGLYPNYNIDPIADDQTGMTSSAAELAAKINLGWNIGNSLEASGSETAWGNPMVSKDLIDLVKQNGFNAIRIPCSFNQYLTNGETAEIDEQWLNRVKEVVQYCIDNDMFTLLNIHWDGGWLEENCTTAKKEENNARQKAFWEQIATHLRDYDEHLLFASANEPNVDNATEMAVLDSYHQTFVNAVRSTGGKNTYRTLVVQGPRTDIEKTDELMNTLPTDTTTDRMMVEVHYYSPWQFTGLTEDASWGTMFYYWGADYHSTTDSSRNATWGEEDYLNAMFDLMKTKFVDKGIPVILGEFGPMRRSSLTGDDLTLHLDSRAFHLKYVVQQAKVYGMLPFYWDNGGIDNHSSGIFNRSDNTVFDQQALTALKEGAN